MTLTDNPSSALIYQFPVRTHESNAVTRQDGTVAEVIALAAYAQPRRAEPALCAAALGECWYHDEAIGSLKP